MPYGIFRQTVVHAVLLFALAFCGLAGAMAAQSSGDGQMPGAVPLKQLLSRFTAANVPALGASETEAPRNWKAKPASPGLPGKSLAQHPMLVLGEGYNSLMIVDQGKIIWTYQTGSGYEYDDAWMLSSGNILFTRMQYIAEVTPDKKVVWRYDAPEGTEIHTCQPIGLDKVMFVLNGLPPKLMVVNIRTKKVEVSHELPFPGMDKKWVHGEFRRARYTAQGTYLVAFLEMGMVVEYDKDFKEIWRYDVPSPWAAIRLNNGNTLITDEGDVETREVNAKGETVWSIKPGDLPEEYRYGNTQSATRLANGNTIICSRGGANEGPQMVEVTGEKKVVWVLQNWTDLGPVTAVQALDEPGLPERPGDSLH